MLDALLAEARLRWGLDPAAGVAVVTAERLLATPIEPSVPLLIVPAAMLGARPATADPPVADAPAVEALPGRHGPRGRDPIALLARLYPADHPVGRFGSKEGLTISDVAADHLGGPLYVPPVAATEAFGGAWAMPAISERLRRPDGCPWDREQTHDGLRNHLLEEAYEVYDTLTDPATPDLAGELGDLWLQIVLHAQLAAEEGVFDLADVQAAIAANIVRRHPHVFGDTEARTARDVNRQWERIKADERAEEAIAAPDGTATRSALDGVSRSLPALAASQEMQERAANLGYDWPNLEGVLEKLREELDEVLAATNARERHEEFGDLLMVLVNVARREGIEAEAALRSANDKFRRRFRSVERQAAERNVALRDLSFEQLDELWNTAKAEEREAAGEDAAERESAPEEARA
jgi:tetrapyrrole methylase family protein/MazG family protein